MTEASVREEVSLDAVVAQAADEFLDRQRRGEKPDIEEYAARHPEAAEVLRKVLASLRLLRLSGSNAGANMGVEAEDSLTGTLGDFRLLREVGRGGMGVVYEAEQISLGRRVALKVLPFAATLDPRSLQRFKNEAQAAAHLHHPHIVPVHGVGCERGVHFYAMQFIDGQTLASVIQDLRRGTGPRPSGSGVGVPPLPDGRGSETVAAVLSTEKSICSPAYCRSVAQLGIQAAEALEYAHRQGIIHRDIKPANLLLASPVASAPGVQVWIADFGLAKLQGQNSLTMSGDVVGTLRYMSPEQALAKHAQVDERTDLYSLGATLYELLTLEPAFPGQDREDLLRRIAQEEPKPLRRLNPPIPAELETIVLKALAKNPEERYATAQELADDLRRFLEDRPVQARRPTPWQRLGKWARRHRVLVRATAAFLALAVLGLAAAAALLWRERQQTLAAKDRAEANAHLAWEAADRWYVQVAARWLSEPAPPTRVQREFLEAAQAFYAQFAAANRTNKVLRKDAFWACLRLGHIRKKLGDLVGAKEAYRQAADVAQELIDDFPDLPIHRGDLALCHYHLGMLLDPQRPEEARAALHQAEHLMGRLVDEYPGNPEFRLVLAMVCNVQGVLARKLRLYDEAEKAFRRAVDEGQRLPGASPANLANALSNLADVLGRTGRPEEAEAVQRRALELVQGLAERHPGLLASCHSQLGRLLLARGDLGAAEDACRKDLALLREMATNFPGVTVNRLELAKGLRQLAAVLHAAGRAAEAAEACHEAVELMRQAVVDFPDAPETRAGLAAMLTALLGLMRDQGRTAEAGRLQKEVWRIQHDLKRRGPPSLQALGGTQDVTR